MNQKLLCFEFINIRVFFEGEFKKEKIAGQYIEATCVG